MHFLRDIQQLLANGKRGDIESLVEQSSRCEYIGNHESIARILGKYLIYVNTLDPSISPHLMMRGYWEMWNTIYFARFVKPGMSVVEVGANLGYFTLLFSDLVGPEGSVVAFEPLSLNYELLKKSVYLNGFSSRTTCVRTALSNQNGSATIQVNPINYGGGSIMHGSEIAGLISERVETCTFDSQFLGKKVDLIKMDAEGAEQLVVQGMEKFLATGAACTIVLEFDPVRFADWQNWLGDLVKKGFALSLIQGDGSAQQVSKIASLAGCGLSELVLQR
jgi:FkbM family methyltransferase